MRRRENKLLCSRKVERELKTGSDRSGSNLVCVARAEVNSNIDAGRLLNVTRASTMPHATCLSYEASLWFFYFCEDILYRGKLCADMDRNPYVPYLGLCYRGKTAQKGLNRLRICR
jgi:hypothetical protein